jgi:hypothetical protein
MLTIAPPGRIVLTRAGSCSRASAAVVLKGCPRGRGRQCRCSLPRTRTRTVPPGHGRTGRASGRIPSQLDRATPSRGEPIRFRLRLASPQPAKMSALITYPPRAGRIGKRQVEQERSPQHFDKVDSAASLSLWLWRSRPGRRPFARRNHTEVALLLEPTLPVRIDEDHLGVQLAVVDWLAASILELDTPRLSILGPFKPHSDKPGLLAAAVRHLIREQNEASEQCAHRQARSTRIHAGARHDRSS